MTSPRLELPSIDQLLRAGAGKRVVMRFGRKATVGALRAALDRVRADARAAGGAAAPCRAATIDSVIAEALVALEQADAPRLRRVFNLTGTVLHTNLGRALLPEEAIAAAVSAMRSPAALEFDLETGGRGERDDAVRGLVRELTGAEDVIAVNNNAAAVMLVLNSLSQGRPSIVSRGELIEIGGAFRMPDIMARAGARLVEVGTTNRTHFKDYGAAVTPDTGLILKVHTSNYIVQGFTKEVSVRELAPLARERGVPLVDDLGSGTLVDLSAYGLRRERTVQDALRDGADLVTFSGDKLLGGPQAGLIAGRKDLVALCAKNPLKRAMRLDKVRLAALEATLRLYRDPDRLRERLPVLRALARPKADIEALASRVLPALAAAVGTGFAVTVVACESQIGSGALPLETIASAGLEVRPTARDQAGRLIQALQAALRGLPIPIIGRLVEGALVLDLRALDDEAALITALGGWRFAGRPDAAL